MVSVKVNDYSRINKTYLEFRDWLSINIFSCYKILNNKEVKKKPVSRYLRLSRQGSNTYSITKKVIKTKWLTV